MLCKRDKPYSAAVAHPGPVFMRVSHEAVPEDLGRNGHLFSIGRGYKLREGRDLTLVATGTMVEAAQDAAHQLQTEGIDAAVIDMPTIKPLDEQMLIESAAPPVPLLRLRNTASLVVLVLPFAKYCVECIRCPLFVAVFSTASVNRGHIPRFCCVPASTCLPSATRPL